MVLATGYDDTALIKVTAKRRGHGGDAVAKSNRVGDERSGNQASGKRDKEFIRSTFLEGKSKVNAPKM